MIRADELRQVISDIHAIATNLGRIAKALETPKPVPYVYPPVIGTGTGTNPGKIYPNNPQYPTITYTNGVAVTSAKPEDNYEI